MLQPPKPQLAPTPPTLPTPSKRRVLVKLYANLPPEAIAKEGTFEEDVESIFSYIDDVEDHLRSGGSLMDVWKDLEE